MAINPVKRGARASSVRSACESTVVRRLDVDLEAYMAYSVTPFAIVLDGVDYPRNHPDFGIVYYPDTDVIFGSGNRPRMRP